MKTILCGLLMMLAFPLMAEPTTATDTTHPRSGIEEKLGQTLPLDLEFYNEDGYLIPLRKAIHKPTILAFVYYKCPGICSPLLTELTRIVDQMDLELGKDYDIVTLSFDEREKPQLAADKRENYLSSIEKTIDPDGWHFFTGDSENIAKLTSAAGFYFYRTDSTFVHPGALIIISPEGKITRYVNGIQYLPIAIKMALLDASQGRTGPTIAKLLRFCYAYDPESHTYALDVTRVAMLTVLGMVLIFVVFIVVKPKKKKPTEAENA